MVLIIAKAGPVLSFGRQRPELLFLFLLTNYRENRLTIGLALGESRVTIQVFLFLRLCDKLALNQAAHLFEAGEVGPWDTAIEE